MKKALILLGFYVAIIIIAACSNSMRLSSYKDSLVCGLSVEDVRKIAELTKAQSYVCYRVGHGPLLCGARWRRDSVQCEFEADKGLVRFRQLKLLPLTQIGVIEEVELCTVDQTTK